MLINIRVLTGVVVVNDDIMVSGCTTCITQVIIKSPAEFKKICRRNQGEPLQHEKLKKNKIRFLRNTE